MTGTLGIWTPGWLEIIGGGLCLLVTAGVIALIVWLIARSKKDEEQPGG